MSLSQLALPVLRHLPPEAAHCLSIQGLKAGLGPQDNSPDDPVLKTSLWGLEFPNPLGLAAGFDKNAEVTGPMLRAGFGFVEAGSITPRPQAGNPRPRLFRLPRDGAVINRMGFNNNGMEVAARNLRTARGRGIVGLNLGKNRESTDAAADYAAVARRLAPFADYLVINVSSPNTPGLRDLQGGETLEPLIAAVREACAAVECNDVPLVVKIAPDLKDRQVEEVVKVALDHLDGLIISNTTIARPETLSHKELAGEAGGLSGKPLFAPSTALLRKVRSLVRDQLPLIGAGGLSSGAEAYEKIQAGACLLQLYTALVYHGPGLIPRIKRELAALLRRDGVKTVEEAVGVKT